MFFLGQEFFLASCRAGLANEKGVDLRAVLFREDEQVA
jgi:hypothetical protein